MKITIRHATLFAAAGITTILLRTDQLCAADIGMTIGSQGTNQLKLTITNAVAGVAYEVYRTPVLGDDLNYPWVLEHLGTVNQTNFYSYNDIETVGFFKATTADWDGDGIPNYQDAQPNSAAIGPLTITIQFPTNGATVN